MIGASIHSGEARDWLSARRASAVERLAMLSPEQRKRALSVALEPVEERLLGTYLEAGRADGGCSLAVLDAIVLDEQVGEWLSARPDDAPVQAGVEGSAPLVPLAEQLERDLTTAEREALAAGWTGVAEQARVGLARVRSVRHRLGGTSRTEARAEARASLEAASARAARRRARVTLGRSLGAVILAGALGTLCVSTLSALRVAEPDPRHAIGAEDFRDLFDLDRIVVEGDRFAAVARNWSDLDEAQRVARVEALCHRLQARGFGAAWLDDRWLRRIAGCGREGDLRAQR